MYWATLLCCLLLCLGCARARPPSPGGSPEAFLATMQQRMEAGLEILYFSAKVDQYHAQCLRRYPTLKEPLDAGYHAFAWDGRDGDGRLANPGLYFVRARIEGSPDRLWRVIRLR